MLKAYKYRLLPTPEQADWFEGLFRACRYVYNLALETRMTAWTTAKVHLSAFDLNKQLPDLKEEAAWLKRFPAQSFESEIANMDSAYKKFFKGGGFPKFKSRHVKSSATFRQKSSIVNNKIKLSKIGLVEFVKHRDIPEGEIRKVVVTKEPTGKYFVSVLVQNHQEPPIKKEILESTAIGVDVGLKSFATLSSGESVSNPKLLYEQLKRLRVEQRKLARRFIRGRKQQSSGYYKQKIIVAKLHEKIANRRKDFLHKLSHEITRAHDTIVVETLNVLGMVKNEKLAKAISDVSWSEFVRMLEYKVEWRGKNLIKIGRFEPSSKQCSNCGLINHDLKLSDREWSCPACGVLHDRDINAAINIKNFGLQGK